MCFLWCGDCSAIPCQSWCYLSQEDPKLQSKNRDIYLLEDEKSVLKAHCAFMYKFWAGLRRMTTTVWTEIGDKNNRRKNKHKTGTKTTFLKIWRVYNGARHRKHMVWLLPAWAMLVDTVVLKSAGTAGSKHTDDSISKIIRNGSHASEHTKFLSSF